PPAHAAPPRLDAQVVGDAAGHAGDDPVVGAPRQPPDSTRRRAGSGPGRRQGLGRPRRGARRGGGRGRPGGGARAGAGARSRTTAPPAGAARSWTVGWAGVAPAPLAGPRGDARTWRVLL